MNSAWQEVQLGEVCEILRGTVITKSQTTAGDVPVVAGGIGPAYFTGTSNRPAGNITISASGNAGYVNYWNVPIFASDCSTVTVRDPNATDIRFIYQQLKFKQPRLMALQQGAAQKHVYAKDIAKVKVFHPSFDEQRRIAAILDQTDTLRAKRNAALAQLDSIAQSIFLDMFGDPLLNPRHWPIAKLGTIGRLDRGVSKHRPRNAPELLGGLHPLVQTGEVANCDGYIRNYNSTYSDLGLRQSKLWPAGTLCITIAANIAKTGILTFDACFPDSVVGFSADDPATVEYVRMWFSFLQQMLEDAAPESAQKNINLAILRALDIPVPPLVMQREFASHLAAAVELRSSYRESSSRLDSLFASLQHRAFRGDL